MNTLKLHGFFASGASYRLRIAINLKGLSYETAAAAPGRQPDFKP